VNLIKSFTSENATVVVGTVIDPEMNEDLRVTVVVTGLSKQSSGGAAINLNTIRSTNEEIKIEPSEIVKADSAVDYHTLEKPAVMRKQAQESSQIPLEVDKNMDYLDIPAFLRRKGEDLYSKDGKDG
jgi:cell division protein FtsZ